MPFGAETDAAGTRFRLWAPDAASVALVLEGPGPYREVPMARDADGWREARVADAGPGTLYRYRIEARRLVPDPASRFQPADVHGPSEVIDARAYAWTHADWRGRPWEETVLYELHVGSFTREGTFAAAARCLARLAEIGVTAIELMPVADFAGRRNWGYDGVFPFAPDSAYGRPEDLKTLVDTAHGLGLMVFLDVVYNHFGPEGNYLGLYARRFFDATRSTPWGGAIAFDAAGNRPVRDFFIENALFWIEEYRVDGLRLDAVEAIADRSRPDILEELAAAVRRRIDGTRWVHLVLENDRNQARYLARDAGGRPRHFVAQWDDDIHHALHATLTGETHGYYADFADDAPAHLVRALAEGFAYQGERSVHRGGVPRGEPSRRLPPTAFVAYLQNHDQIGNRALGERIGFLAPDDAIRAATALVLLAPSIPLLFMGQEWGSTHPFLFFCDLGDDLKEAVREGRLRAFARFAGFRDADARRLIPDPTAADTFARCVLDVPPAEDPAAAGWIAFHRRLLAVRRREITPHLVGARAGRVLWRDGCAFVVTWPLANDTRLTILANLASRSSPTAPPPRDGRRIFATGTYPTEEHGGPLPPWSLAAYVDGA